MEYPQKLPKPFPHTKEVHITTAVPIASEDDEPRQLLSFGAWRRSFNRDCRYQPAIDMQTGEITSIREQEGDDFETWWRVWDAYVDTPHYRSEARQLQQYLIMRKINDVRQAIVALREEHTEALGVKRLYEIGRAEDFVMAQYKMLYEQMFQVELLREIVWQMFQSVSITFSLVHRTNPCDCGMITCVIEPVPVEVRDGFNDVRTSILNIHTLIGSFDNFGMY